MAAPERTVAVLADTHMPRGSRRLPEACLERLRAADLVIHAGDISSATTLDAIAGLSRELVAVYGNVDDAEVRARLPGSAVVDVADVRIAVIHDAGPARGRLARLRRRFPEADAVVFGHSHIPLHERDGDFQIFNPGSPTERRRAPTHTMGLAAITAGEIRFAHVTLS